MSETFTQYCVLSGDFFSFVYDESPKAAVKQYVFSIIQARGGTLGAEIVVLNNYNGKGGKIIGKFNTEEMLRKICEEHEHLKQEIRFEKRDDRIVFTKTPFRRSSSQDVWQRFYWAGEEMVKVSGSRRDIWIQSAFRMNPFVKVEAMRNAEPVLEVLRRKIIERRCLKSFGGFVISTVGAEGKNQTEIERNQPCVVIYFKKDARAKPRFPVEVGGYRVYSRVRELAAT